MKDLKVKITFTESVLGTMPNNAEVYSDFIAAKAPDASTLEDEIAAVGVAEVDAKGRTVFPRLEDGTPFLYDYQIRGFFKGVCGFLRMVPGTKSSGVKAYKKMVDGLIFINDRKIPFHDVTEIGNCQRPLRAQTMQGERVSLASSDEIPAGAWIEFTVHMMRDSDEPLVREWLDYGSYHGIGQWRNSGHGRFTWEEIA